jgi:hypothetical protein
MFALLPSLKMYATLFKRCMNHQGRAGVLKRTTNEQRLMGPRPGDSCLNIKIFSPKLLAGGGRNFFPDVQKIFPTYQNFVKFFQNIFVNLNFYNINCNVLILIFKIKIYIFNFFQCFHFSSLNTDLRF